MEKNRGKTRKWGCQGSRSGGRTRRVIGLNLQRAADRHVPLISTPSFPPSRAFTPRALCISFPLGRGPVTGGKTFILDSEITALILAGCSVELRRFAAIRPVTLRINGAGKLHRGEGAIWTLRRGRHRHSPTTRPSGPGRSPPRGDKFERMRPTRITVECV